MKIILKLILIIGSTKVIIKTEFFKLSLNLFLQLVQLQGEWKRGCSAGGSRNNLEMFAKNPQFLLTVGPLSQFHPNTPEGKNRRVAT